MAKKQSAMPAPLSAILLNKPVRWALIAGVAAGAALMFIPNPFDASTRWLFAWDLAAAVFLMVLIGKMIGATPEHMAKHAAETDEGRGFLLLLSLAAGIASVTSIWLELSSSHGGNAPWWQAPLVFVTVGLSWLFIHSSFASHYAHDYYGPADKGGGPRKGLLFPGDEAPDFWDFWHFALVIGVANQTADVQIESKTIRRTVTVHGIAAFLFNTVILALAINVAAGLFN